MCTFSSDLPSSQYGANHKKAPITLFLKPNDPNNDSEKYRFRILNFRSQSKNDRVYPFISRYVHNHWGTNDNGFRIVDDCVVCPSTPHVDAKGDESLGFTETYRELKLKDKKAMWDNVCPVCRQVAAAWNAWKSSGKTDRLALERISAMKKQFQGVIPVYVVNDPVNEKNNGRFKCIIFSNQDEYKQFIDIVNRERAKIAASGNSYTWCNGKNAVDFYLRMEKVPVIYNEGKPNEKQGIARRITKMAFGAKAYDLLDNNGAEIVTKEAIDRFEFDDQYYVRSTKTELEEFYKKHYSIAARNIPDEDEDVFSGSTTTVTPSIKQTPVQIPTNPAVKPSEPASSQIIDDLVNDSDDIPFEGDNEIQSVKESQNAPLETPTQSVDDLLDQLDFND